MDINRLAVCRHCLAIPRRPCSPYRWTTAVTASRSFNEYYRISTPSRSEPPVFRKRPNAPHQPLRSYAKRVNLVKQTRTAKTTAQDAASDSELQEVHARIRELSASVLKPQDGKIPSEQRLLYVLEQLESLGKSLEDEGSVANAKNIIRNQRATATSALLGSVNHYERPSSITRSGLLTFISHNAEQILRHANVFITPAVLKKYIGLQSFLHQPSSFPDVLSLYANKDIPVQSGNGQVKYSKSNPNKVNAAIDVKTADAALDAAISAHNLPLALDLIDVTYCPLAFKKSRVLRKALVPIVSVALAPFAAYAFADKFSHVQDTMPLEHARSVAFVGILVYFLAVGTTGYAAVTTANDQMDRVTWAPGVPLWERWLREDERAAFDKVAGAWGFKEIDKRGDEEGQEWEDLRNIIGYRGMILDRVSLMPGMQ